jgi:hypothetical protein
MIFFSERHAGYLDFATFFHALPLSGSERVKHVCLLLDIAPLTLQRYLTGERKPPKAAVRLLFMESDYGQSAVANKWHHGFVIDLRLRRELEADRASLQAQLAATEAENTRLRAALAQADAPAEAANESFAQAGRRTRPALPERSYRY